MYHAVGTGLRNASLLWNVLEKLACYERTLMLKTLVHLTNVMVHYSMITPCMDYPFALGLCCAFSLSASKRTAVLAVFSRIVFLIFVLQFESTY